MLQSSLHGGVAVSAAPVPNDMPQEGRRRVATPNAVEARALPPSTLPLQPNPLLDRYDELQLLTDVLLSGRVRLLSLTGPAGVGKTRLAIDVAAKIREYFPDGAFFIDLAGVQDAEVALHAIVSAVHAPETGDQSELEPLIRHLQDHRVLLLLDNVDNVLAAAPYIGEIVERCNGVAALVTSRARLNLRAEHVQPIAPLPLPALDDRGPDELEIDPGVRLFIERAQAVRTDFAPDASDIHAIAAICRRLDGLPLAIELAAARINVLSPASILRRLETRKMSLRQQSVDISERHQSMDAALAVSYDSLSDHEKQLLIALAIFTDGFTVEAASTVVPAEPDLDVLERLASLVDKSMIVADQDAGIEPRFHLLQTVNAYMLTHMRDADLGRLRRLHGEYYLTLAERAAPELKGPDQDIWMDRLDIEKGNLRSALDWVSSVGGETHLRLAIALTDFWLAHGDTDEGIRHLAGALERSARLKSSVRGQALISLSRLVRHAGSAQRATSKPLNSFIKEGLALGRSHKSPALGAQFVREKALLEASQGDVGQALGHLEEARVLWQTLSESREVGLILQDISEVELRAGNVEQAEIDAAKSISVFQGVADQPRVVVGRLLQARAAELQGHLSHAAELVAEALALTSMLRAERLTLLAAHHAAWLMAQFQQPESAGRMLGTIEAVCAASGYVEDAVTRSLHEDTRALLLTGTSKQNVTIWMRAGSHLTLKQEVDKAREELAAMVVHSSGSRPARARMKAVELSCREREVLHFLSEGLSNRQIADRLDISENTAKFHVTSILNKLGADNRARVVALAGKLNLL